jgi:hypothetical protein
MFVAHGHIVSSFDVLHSKWVKHIDFGTEIDFMFRQQDPSGEFEIGVLLVDGNIKMINNHHAPGSHQHGMNVDESLHLKIKGKIVEVSQDREDNLWTFILSDINGDPHLNCLYHNKLYDITSQINHLTGNYYYS